MKEEYDDFIEDDPLAAPVNAGPAKRGRRTRLGSAREKWSRAAQKATGARERSEFFLRENPVPMIVGALIAGLAIGLAIRYASRSDEKETKLPLLGKPWSILSLPFLWPFFKSLKQTYEDSAEAVTDSVRNIDVQRYTKPIRKRWKSWTH
jgi:hypothetical protein